MAKDLIDTIGNAAGDAVVAKNLAVAEAALLMALLEVVAKGWPANVRQQMAGALEVVTTSPRCPASPGREFLEGAIATLRAPV